MRSPKEDLARDLEAGGCYVPRSGEKTPQLDIPRPKSRRWGEVPHRRLGMAAWTRVAKASCLPPFGLDGHREVKKGESGGSVGTTY